MNQLKTDRTKENISKLYRLRAEYNTIAGYRTKGAIIRSGIRWHENGEKNTKYFLNMGKRQHCKSRISKLKENDDTEINDPKTILEQGKMFYKNCILRYTAKTRIIHYSLKTQILLNSKQLNKRNLSARFSTKSAFSH